MRTSPVPTRRTGRWLSLLSALVLTACAGPGPAPSGTDAPAATRPATGVAAPTASVPVAAPGPSQAPTPAPTPAPARPASVATPVAEPPAVLPGPPFAAGGSLILEPGLYRCELNRRVVLRRIAPDGQSLVINWLGKDATLQAVQARTGALRFESPPAGLVWLVIVGKSMLLDSRQGRTLANECRL